MLKYCDKDGIEKTIIDNENINDYVSGSRQENTQEIIEQLLERISALESLKNGSFDAIWPVGIVYVQYPQQKSPVELFAGTGSQWKVLNYNGAAFRAEGGKALAFCEQGRRLVMQKSQISSHSHTMSHTHTRGNMEIWGTGQFAAWSNAPYSPTVYIGCSGAFAETDFYDGQAHSVSLNGQNNYTLQAKPGNFYASRAWSGNTSEPTNANTGSSGSDETRMDNYTVRVWVRTA